MRIIFFLLIPLLLQSQLINSQTLKSLADQKGKYLGNLMRNGFFEDPYGFNEGATDNLASTEYNTLVVGNKMKMSALLNTRPTDPFNVQISDIKTSNIDTFVNYANSNGMRKRGHVMVWYKQIPTWLANEAPGWTAQEVYDFTESYIKTLSSYTAGKIDEWDVLNEAIISSGFRTGTWYDIVNTEANDAGEIGYLTFFSNLFKWAREADPNVPLFYNDYNIEEYGTDKNTFLINMVQDLKNAPYNSPIDGVGLQSHFPLATITADATFIEKVGQTIDELGAMGFTANITELDLRMCEGDGTTLEQQKAAYKEIVKTAFSKANCNTILIWGISDNDSWIPGSKPGCDFATPHDENFQQKPAYFGIREALQELNADLINNIGSFDIANPLNSWTTNTNNNGNFNVITSESYFGTSSLKTTVTAANISDVSISNTYDFPIATNTTYTASFYLKGTVGNEFTISLMNGSTQISAQTDKTTLDEWTYYTFSFTSTNASSSGKIKINFKEIGDYYLDEFIIKKGASSKWYVSESGSNSNSGSESSPFKTINHAINNAWVTGDIIYVMNGTYQNNGFDDGTLDNGNVVYINRLGTLNGPLVIKNYPGHSPKIEFDGSGGFIANKAQYLEISGFEIQGPNKKITKESAAANRLIKDNFFKGKGIAIWASGTQTDGNKGHHIILHSNKIYDCPGSGIRIDNADYCVITNNEVFNTTTYSSSGESAIVLAQSKSIDSESKIKMRITKNKAYDNVNKIHYFNSSYSCSNSTDYACEDYPNIIDGSGCYITRNNDRGTGANDENPNGQYEGSFLFANNIAYGNGINGVVVHKSDNSIVMNNTVYFNGAVPLDEGRQNAGGITINNSNNVRIYNNISWTRYPTDVGYKKYGSPTDLIGSNNILINGSSDISNLNTDMITLEVTDALFVDQNNFDFRLSLESNALNAGANNNDIILLTDDVTTYEYLPKYDIENNSRVLNISDVGAFESVDISGNGIADHLKRNKYTFDNVLNNEGFMGTNGVTLSQPIKGEIKATITDASNYPKFYQNNTYFVDANTNKKLQITLVNKSPKNRITFVVKDANGENPSYTGNAIIPSDGVSDDPIQTITYDLSENSNWTGEQSEWFLQLTQVNPLTKSAGTIQIQELLFYSHKWTGATNNDWNTASNWDTGSVPISSSNVYIPGGLTNYPTASNAVEINSVSIASGATLIAQSTFSADATYSRNLTTDNWYLISSALENEALADFIESHQLAVGQNPKIGLAPYDNSKEEMNNRWNYLTSETTGYFESGTGYSLKLDSIRNISFTGKMPTSDFNNLKLSDHSGTNGTSYNLKGNPYPSYVSLTDLLNINNTGNNNLLTESTIWIWDGDEYDTFNLGSNYYIAPGQSFFVSADGASNTFSITEAIQSHQTSDTFQKNSTSKSQIILKISDGTITKKTKINYTDMATVGFDDGYDSSIFAGNSNPFEVYTQLTSESEGENLAIQSLPKQFENIMIPLGINALSRKEIVFSIETLNLPKDVKVFLEDREINTFTRLDLSNSSYKITLNNDLNGTGRFYLYTSYDALGLNDDLSLNEINIYVQVPQRQLRVSGGLEETTKISVYDIQGRLVLIKMFGQNSNSTNIDISDINQGIYLVKVESGKKIKNKKIIIY